MSLTSALDTAKSSLAATQAHTSLVSRNIANINTPGATRKYANVVTGFEGRVEIASVAQSSNSVLYRNMLESSSALNAASTVAEGLSRINETIGDTDLARSPAALLSNLGDALQSLAVTPNNRELASSAVQAAQDLATVLNEGAATIQVIRRDADASLKDAAAAMNTILGDIETLNQRIVSGTALGVDVTDFIDGRDQAVAKLSEYVGVTARTRGSNDLVLYTDSGVTLFETKPRLVEFDAKTIVPGQPGGVFKIDGVAVTGPDSYMPIRSGMVFGLVQLRDEVALTYEHQLDEIARGLVETFTESDATGASTPLVSQAGLFTSSTAAVTSTVSSLPVGVFDPGTIAAGDTLEFVFSVGGVPYQASGTFAAADVADAGSFRTKLQSMVDLAVATSDGTTPFPGGMSVVDSEGAISFRATATGAGAPIALSLSGVVALAGGAGSHDGTKDGGLTAAAAATAANVQIRSFATGAGLAGTLRIAANVRGDPLLLRDGGINGAAYDANALDAGGFTPRLTALIDGLGAARSFSADADVATDASLFDFATSSLGWLQAARAGAMSETEYKATLLDRTKETLSDATGVNLADEMTLLIDLERSYQASAKLISTIDEMLATLLQSV